MKKNDNIEIDEKKKKRNFILFTSIVILVIAVVSVMFSYRFARLKEFDKDIDLYALEITKDASLLEEYANNFTIDLTNGGDLDYSYSTKTTLAPTKESIENYYNKIVESPFYLKTSNNKHLINYAISLHDYYLIYKTNVLYIDKSILSGNSAIYQNNVKIAKDNFISAYNKFNLIAKTQYIAPDHFVFETESEN